MSLPENSLSTINVPGTMMAPDDLSPVIVEDWELGGVDLLDTSGGLMAATWHIYVSGIDVMIQKLGAAATVLFQQSGIKEIALAFDQNMRPVVAFRTASSLTYLRWYDTQSQQYVTDGFGDLKNPKLSLDDKRPMSSSTSDVIFAYIRENNLCYRQQRDRYGIEYVLDAGLSETMKLKSIGMGDGLRMQFEVV